MVVSELSALDNYNFEKTLIILTQLLYNIALIIGRFVDNRF